MSAPAGQAQASHTTVALEADLSWRDRARCAGLDPELFFPTKGRGANGSGSGQARLPGVAICFRCDVQLQCLQYALAFPDGKHGIWGGATEAERRALRRGRIA